MTSNFNGNSSAKGIEDRFTAAVNVIRGLPKNGKYIQMNLNLENTFTSNNIQKKSNENRPSGNYVNIMKMNGLWAVGKSFASVLLRWNLEKCM